VTQRSWLAWWYLTIAVGFALLALNRVITNDSPLAIVIRLIIAAGFGLLSYMEFSAKKRP
jgi:hypothetical protein